MAAHQDRRGKHWGAEATVAIGGIVAAIDTCVLSRKLRNTTDDTGGERDAAGRLWETWDVGLEEPIIRITFRDPPALSRCQKAVWRLARHSRMFRFQALYGQVHALRASDGETALDAYKCVVTSADLATCTVKVLQISA